MSQLEKNNDTAEWFYEENGKRKGPIPEIEIIIKLIQKQLLTVQLSGKKIFKIGLMLNTQN